MKTKFLLFTLLIFFCSCQKQKYGTVTEKWHEPERTYVTFFPMTMSSGKTFRTIMVPFIVHDNEDWCIKVKGVTRKGNTTWRQYYVSSEAYDTLYVGSFICIDDNCKKEDWNNTKKRK